MIFDHISVNVALKVASTIKNINRVQKDLHVQLGNGFAIIIKIHL